MVATHVTRRIGFILLKSIEVGKEASSCAMLLPEARAFWSAGESEPLGNS